MGGASSSAGASPGSDSTFDDSPDVLMYAAEVGVSKAEAARRLDLQEEAGRLSALYEGSGADWFGGLWIEHQPDFGIVIATTDTSKPEIATALATSPLRNSSSVVLVGRNLAALSADAELVGGELPGYIVDVHAQSNAVRIEGPSRAESDAGTRRARITSRVEFKQSNRKMVKSAFIYAGQTLNSAGSPACTSGFSVLKGSTRRITTAAHCPDALTRNGIALGTISSMFTGSHDEQLMSTGTLTPTNRTADNSRDTTSPNYRTITSKRTRANQALNSYFCRHGYGTVPQYACGYLISKTHVGGMPSPAATSMRLAASGIDLASPGDSGGPVFTGGTALGIMHSCLSDDDLCDNPALDDELAYIAIDFVESGLGVTVLTVP